MQGKQDGNKTYNELRTERATIIKIVLRKVIPVIKALDEQPYSV